MTKFIVFIMYLLWFITACLILAATFMDFKYEDLNILAVVFLIFSVINSIFVVGKRKRKG